MNKNQKILYICSAIFLAVALLTVYNWLPRRGWKTTDARTIGMQNVEFYTDSGRVETFVQMSGQTKSDKYAQKPVRIQYNPQNPSEAKIAPTTGKLTMSAVFAAIAVVLFLNARKAPKKK